MRETNLKYELEKKAELWDAHVCGVPAKPKYTFLWLLILVALWEGIYIGVLKNRISNAVAQMFNGHNGYAREYLIGDK